MVLKLVLLVAFASLSVALPRAIWGTRLPTEGGRTVLYGFEFVRTLENNGTRIFPTDTSSIEVVVGGIPCLNVRVHKDTALSCDLPPNTGGCGLNIVTVSNTGMITATRSMAPGYWYLPPVIETLPTMWQNGTGWRNLTITGRNFGLLNNNTVFVTLLKPFNSAPPVICENVTVTVPHREIRCMVNVTGLYGDYQVRIEVGTPGVDGCLNSFTTEPMLTIGTCYGLQSLTINQINKLMLQKALRKNINRLMDLRGDLAFLKSRLPPHTENTCCGENHVYMVSLLHMARGAQFSNQFKDCLSDFCDKRNLFQETLLTLPL